MFDRDKEAERKPGLAYKFFEEHGLLGENDGFSLISAYEVYLKRPHEDFETVKCYVFNEEDADRLISKNSLWAYLKKRHVLLMKKDGKYYKVSLQEANLQG